MLGGSVQIVGRGRAQDRIAAVPEVADRIGSVVLVASPLPTRETWFGVLDAAAQEVPASEEHEQVVGLRRKGDRWALEL